MLADMERLKRYTIILFDAIKSLPVNQYGDKKELQEWSDKIISAVNEIENERIKLVYTSMCMAI